MDLGRERCLSFVHELNNSLASISGHAVTLRLRLDAGELDENALRRALDEIAAASAEAAKLARDLAAEVVGE